MQRPSGTEMQATLGENHEPVGELRFEDTRVRKPQHVGQTSRKQSGSEALEKEGSVRVHLAHLGECWC